MVEAYTFHRGSTPLLVSMPHSGIQVPDDILERFTSDGKTLPDTDWHVPELYDFVEELGASVIRANFSRYVVDLNRPPDDRALYTDDVSTGLVPTQLFDGSPLYTDEQLLSKDDITERVDTYWNPYHKKIAETLTELKDAHGYALLYDAHSIASRVPNLFKGKLSDLNLGTANAESCAPEIGFAVAEVIRSSDFTSTVNGRFVGGYITRYYGKPNKNVHALQMEISQAAYMSEEEPRSFDTQKAEKLRPVLRQVFAALQSSMVQEERPAVEK